MSIPKNFKCEKCGKLYAREGNLKKHLKTHKHLLDFPNINKGLFLLFFGFAVVFLPLNLKTDNNLSYLFGGSIIFLLVMFIISRIRPNLFERDFFKIMITFIISAMLLAWGTGNISDANRIEDSMNVEYGDYDFMVDFSPTERIRLHSFLLFFDFRESVGNISFRINKDYLKNISNLIVRVPEELKITEPVVYSGSVVYKENISYDVDYYLKNSVNINDFKISENSSIDNYIGFVIPFHGEIIPVGKFDLRVESERLRTHDEGSIEFVLGKYVCVYPCFSETENIDVGIKSNVLVAKIPNDYYENVPEGSYRILKQGFWINTLDKNVIRKIEYERYLGISLIAGAILLFFQALLGTFVYSFEHR